jgi:isoamylase
VGEQDGRFDPLSGFLDAMRQDTVLSLVKLIAEPWIGPDGYHFGVPADRTEWNDRFRVAVRRFWKGDDGVIGEIALHIIGSRDGLNDC